MDFGEVLKTVRAIAAKVGGDTAATTLDAQLTKAGESLAFSLVDLLNGWKGRTAVVLRLHPTEMLRIPAQTPFVVPTPSLLISVDGVGQALAAALAKSPFLSSRVEGKLTVFESKMPLPLNGIRPVIAVEGSSLYVATTPDFLMECLSGASSLGTNPVFHNALAKVGPFGNGITYASPALFEKLRRISELNAGLPEQARGQLQVVLGGIEVPAEGLVSVRSNLPDGILVRSYWDRSLKKDLGAIAVYNPVTIGLMAAMAIPAFEKVREASQEKAILNNLRQLEAAADQFYLEHGVNTARFEDLVGPTKYIKSIQSVVGEDYRQLRFQSGKRLRIPVQALHKFIEATAP